MKILILTTGSISAYLSHKLAVQLENDGHIIKHYATEAVQMLVNAKSDSWQTYNDYNDLKRNAAIYTGHYSPHIDTRREILDWRDKPAHPVLHIDLVNWADICVVCPADYNIVGKMANGIADDVVSCTLAAWLGSGKKLYICEAMNCMMYASPVYQENRKKLDKLSFTRFIEPTVKKLACGDFGIGALADVNTIKNIVEGHVWSQPIASKYLIEERQYAGDDDLEHYKIVPLKCQESFASYLPRFDEPGAFGAKRKFDVHEGVDIYCVEGAHVAAVEDGKVVDSYQYTGANAACQWWNDTWCIKVKGKSGVITYGELMMPDSLPCASLSDGTKCGIKYPKIGTKVKAGDFIGVVGRVLKENKLRPDIRHHNTSMLHMELRTESCHIDGWKLDGDRDKRLLDPTPYLKSKEIIEV